MGRLGDFVQTNQKARIVSQPCFIWHSHHMTSLLLCVVRCFIPAHRGPATLESPTPAELIGCSSPKTSCTRHSGGVDRVGWSQDTPQSNVHMEQALARGQSTCHTSGTSIRTSPCGAYESIPHACACTLCRVVDVRVARLSRSRCPLT